MLSRLLLTLVFALSASFVQAAEKLKVISFSTVLTEVAQRVGGDQLEVTGLVKPGSDPHDFEPKPDDLKQVAAANLVLLSAKHMEGYVDKLHEAAGTKGKILEVGNQLPSIATAPKKDDHEHDHKHGKDDHDHDHDHGPEDPHWWHSIENVRRATRVVQKALAQLRPEAAEAFAANATAYTKELTTLEQWAKKEIATVPRNRRKLVTTHDAFQYFAKDFGFKLYPIEGISSESQTSSREVAQLVAEIKKQAVPAIFLEDTANAKVTETITQETGAKLGGMLYADGLGEGEAGTYAGMFRHNVSTIVAALK